MATSTVNNLKRALRDYVTILNTFFTFLSRPGVVCVRVCVCDADILLSTTNQIKLVFGVRVITADSSFVLDMGSDPRMEKETF